MPLTPSDVPPDIATEFRPPHEFAKDGLTIPELYDWHATANPNYPLFTYRDGAKLEYITYSTANRAINRAASYVASGLDRQTPQAGSPLPVIAVFANADTITYFCFAIGIMRAGCTAFLISTRNGPAGVADMLQRTGSSQLIVSQDATLRGVAEEALSNLPSGQVKIRDMPIFEDLFPQSVEKAADNPYTSVTSFPKTYMPDSRAVILHSSGSTGHPKPISWAHKDVQLWGRLPMASEVDTTRSIMGCHGTPMFHGLGAFMYSASPLCGYTVAVLKPATPPTFPTPDAVWEGIVATKSDFSWSVPSFIEEWARDPEKVIFMKRMRGMMFGGAPLNQAVGDALASQGVKLFIIYGLTEVGLISTLVRADPGMDWQYFALNPAYNCKLLPRDDNKFEIVVLPPPEPLPVINTKVDGKDAYATNDLIEPHPTKPGLWRIYGRADEQIMLSNGEKTNPLPLERIINEDPAVNCSVMFGRGKFQNGVLVEPAEDLKIDPSDTKQVEAFRNKIWPTIERANEYAPRHSRIFKEMILVTSPSKPFQFNVKGLPRRSIILGQYNDEIEALYKQVEESAQNELQSPAVWDEESTRSFIRSVVERTLRRPVADDADIFHNGGDSLQATWIRNTILRAVRETEPGAVKRLPTSLVFQAPTIAALASIVYAAISNPADAGSSPSYTANDLWKYVEKYSASLPARPTALVDRPENGKDVVLITGTTGGFGCDALEHLLREERVERVYAFNRKGSDALIRQRAQFRARGLDESLLDTPKFQMVEAVLHEPGFGVDPEVLDEIRRSVTHIMHNAWRVNFNLSLPSFEVDMQGARNLIDLAINSPFNEAPPVLFVSSVGVFMGYDGPAPAPEAPLNDPKTAYGTGYAESKWVTERVLENATKVGVHTVVMRLGQVAGNKVGYWNEKEWFPALVKTAQFQRCLPDIEGAVTWIPSYEAAKAFTEMRHSPEPYLHLVHPRPVPLHDLIAPIVEELGVPLVSYEKWLSALQESAKEGDASEIDLMKANPALRLLSFFKGLKPSPDHEPLGIVYLSTEKAAKVSEALANLPQLSAEYAKGWVAAWKRAGFL